MIIDDKIKSSFSVRLPKKICQVPNKFSRTKSISIRT